MSNFNAIPLTILSGAAITDLADVRGHKIFALINPAVDTVNYSLTAGHLADGTDQAIVVDSAGVVLTFVATDSRVIAIDDDSIALALAASHYIKFVADTGNETAERSLVLLASD